MHRSKFIALSTCLILLTTPWSWARGPKDSLSTPVFRDDGEVAIPFKVTVGTQTPVLLFSSDSLKNRTMLIINPSVTYNLMIGTSSNFNVTDLYWIILKSSGSETLSNHAAYWAMFPPGGSSETVRGKVEKQ